MKVGYIRASDDDQTEALQTDALAAASVGIRQAARNIKKFLSSADDTPHNVISLSSRR